MNSTLRTSAIALAAALALGAAGGCATSSTISAKPVAAGAGSAAVTPPETTPAVPIAVPATTPAAVATTAPATPSTRAAAPPTASVINASLAAQGVPCQATAVACVSLSKQEAWLLHDGQVVYGPVRVATGRASLPTPAGIFHVMFKVRDSWSAPYQAWMPWAVYFHGGDAFHEDPVTVRSHGCVHLSATNAEYFYNYLQVGNEVQVAD